MKFVKPKSLKGKVIKKVYEDGDSLVVVCGNSTYTRIYIQDIKPSKLYMDEELDIELAHRSGLISAEQAEKYMTKMDEDLDKGIRLREINRLKDLAQKYPQEAGKILKTG